VGDAPGAPPLGVCILFTHGLRGDLAVLPRLFTRMRALAAEAAEAGLHVVRFDLGAACSPAAWHCTLTGGRSMWVALDGMGYHAAVGDSEEPERARSAMGELVQLALVWPGHAYSDGLLTAFVGERPADDARLAVRLAPSAETRIEDDLLLLAPPPAGTVGVVWVDAERRIVHAGHSAPAATAAPDPTIAGVVDFIEREARYKAKKAAERGEQPGGL
jgi:hypothetical protein